MRPELTLEHDHRAARARLEAAGWTPLARGDWATVLRSPDGREVARVCAIDPAYRVHAEDCLSHPELRWLPRVHEVRPLAACGYVVFLEALEPADPAAASELCGALGAVGHLGRPPTARETERWRTRLEGDPSLQQLLALLERNRAMGEASIGFFGGLDIRPENVLADAAGQLKVVDPYFVAGPRLVEALRHDPELALRAYTPAQLAAFLEIAVFELERERPGAETRALRERVAALAARPAPPRPPTPTLLETERLRLRRFVPEDADAVFAMDSDPEVMRYLNRCFPTPRYRIESQVLPRLTERPGLDPWPGFFAAESRDGRLLGWFHLVPEDEDPAVVELGYRLVRSAWGQGLATEGSAALCRLAFRDPRVRAVSATTLDRNPGSRRVMQKLGMRFERHFHYTAERLPGWTPEERLGVRYRLDRPARLADARRGRPRVG